MEQQRIGQELHDTTAQELTSLGLLANSVLQDLDKKSPAEARTVAKLVEGIKRVLGQIRTISQGLLRVHVDAGGLMEALEQLAAEATEMHGVPCSFHCKDPVRLADHHRATQLFCIAREGVTNALRHANAPNIRIELESEDHSVTLRVQDNGVGFRKPPIHRNGMGLKIMHYRAQLINAHLSVGRSAPRGTTVTCTCSINYHPAQRDGQR